MKRILALGLASIFAMPVLSTMSMVAYAETTGQGSQGNTGTATTAAPADKPTTTAATATVDDAKAISERIAQRKTALKTKLTTAEKTRLLAKCKGSQTNIGTVKGRVQGIETSRSEVYKNLQGRLTDLSTKLKNKGVDTTALDADIATLKTKIDTFNTDLTAYKQAVSDLAGMDCSTDPEGFKASLETARTALKKVSEDATAIRSYLTETVKPVLKTIREQLSTNTTTGNSTGGNN